MSDRRSSLAPAMLGAVAVLASAATAVMVGDQTFTTIGGRSPWWRGAEVVATVALVMASLVLAPAGRRAAALSLGALALVLPLPEWGGWSGGATGVRTLADGSVGIVVATALVAVTAVLAAPRRPGSAVRRRRYLLLATWSGALAVAVGRVLLTDPFEDARCARFCDRNPWAIGGTSGAGRVVVAAGTGLLAAAAVATLAGGALRERGRRRRLPTVVGAAILVAGLCLWAVGRAAGADPAGTVVSVGFGVALIGAVALASAVCFERHQERRLRATLYEVVGEVRAAAPGSLEGALARALDDPHVRLRYWSDAHGHLDANGAASDVASAADERRVVTTIVRRGQPVAAIEHDAAVEPARIERVIGPAFRLLLENEQLRAESEADLAELRASRTRIVERADQERRRLERNLHDGAQQRVVSMALALRALRVRLARAPDAAREELVAQAETIVTAMLDDLRRLARGIHPAVLADGGLAAAIPDLAESSTDVAVCIDALPAGRLPPVVEAAAYLVVAEVLGDARRRSATMLTVQGSHDGDVLVLELSDDGHRRDADAPDPLAADLNDRVGALDGELVEIDDPSLTRRRLELPCAS